MGRGAAETAVFPPSSLFFRESEVVNNKDNQMMLRGDSVISSIDYIAKHSGLFGIYAPAITSAAGLRQKQKRQKQKNQQLYINQRKQLVQTINKLHLHFQKQQ